MNTMKRVAQAWAAALALVVVAGSGCMALYGPRAIQWSNPQLDGYYTGIDPRFATRRNPDPQGRKFRVAFIQVFSHACKYIPNNMGIGNRPGYHLEEGELRAVVEKELKGAAYNVMPFREQALESGAHKYYLDSPDLYRAARKTAHSKYGAEEALVAKFLANTYDPRKAYSMASPIDHAFLEGWPSAAWTRKLNAELEMRYPEVFSSDASAFPLDVWLVVAFDAAGPQRVRSLYEAWLLGVPEHATITFHDTVTEGAIFQAEQAHTDPYDAIAAAVFKLSAEQLENLEPANPNDHVPDGEE